MTCRLCLDAAETALDEVAAAIRAERWSAPTVATIADIVARSGRAVPAWSVDKDER